MNCAFPSNARRNVYDPLVILDDEMMIRQGIRYAINWEEHDIVVCGEASNGRAALRSLPSCNPDVIIADIQMPQMDGFSFLEKAREILPHIKVIILTGYSSHDYMAQAIRCGAFDYLEKPAESEAILSSVLKAQCQIQLEQSDAQRSEDVMQLFNATGNLSRAWLIQNLFTIGLEEDFCCRIGRMLGLPLGNGTRYHLLLFRPVEKEIWPLLTALADQFHTHMLRASHFHGPGRWFCGCNPFPGRNNPASRLYFRFEKHVRRPHLGHAGHCPLWKEHALLHWSPNAWSAPMLLPPEKSIFCPYKTRKKTQPLCWTTVHCSIEWIAPAFLRKKGNMTTPSIFLKKR